jgi:hypothetical protein
MKTQRRLTCYLTASHVFSRFSDVLPNGVSRVRPNGVSRVLGNQSHVFGQSSDVSATRETPFKHRLLSTDIQHRCISTDLNLSAPIYAALTVSTHSS